MVHQHKRLHIVKSFMLVATIVGLEQVRSETSQSRLLGGDGADERPLSIRGMLSADPGRVSDAEAERARGWRTRSRTSKRRTNKKVRLLPSDGLFSVEFEQIIQSQGNAGNYNCRYA